MAPSACVQRTPPVCRPCRHLQVTQAAVFNLVHDAGVRTALRQECFKYMVVSSEATDSGEAVLDPFHKCVPT